jgi:hypothetical protein
VSWRLVPYEVYTEIGRYALLWKMWVDFPYLIRIFCVREITSLISLEKTSKGKWLAMHFLLSSLSCGVMGAPVCLLRDSRRLMLVRVAEWRAKPPLPVRVAPILGGNRPLAIHCLPRMISCTVYKWSPLWLSDSISCRVSDIDSLNCPFHRVLCTRTTVPSHAFSTLVA